MTRLCPTCATPVPEQESAEFECSRCGHRERAARTTSAAYTLAFSLTALILYVPANLYPFMTIELYGDRNSSTIWGGIVSLFEAGSVGIALIVFLASLVIPILKLLILFYLALASRSERRRRFKTQLHRFVEGVGRWSMLDIFLLAVLVAILKLGHIATVHAGTGSILYALVVLCSMLASAFFDTKLIWRDKTNEAPRGS